MAIAPVTVVDTFKRANTGSWGVTDTGHTWLGETSDYNVSSSRGTIYTAPGSALKHTYIDVPNNASQELLVKMKVNTTNVMTDWGPVICRVDSDTFYYARIQPNFNTVAIWVNRDGTEDNLSGNTSFTVLADTYYWVRFKRTGSTLTFKIWLEGANESTATTVTCSLSGAPGAPGAGDFGIYTRGSSTAFTVSVATLYWYTLEDEEPALPVTDTFTRQGDNGWGVSDSVHVWEGHMNDDPAYYALNQLGSVLSTGYGLLTTTSNATRITMIGPNSADQEVLVEVEIDQTLCSIHIGMRGALQANASGVLEWTGYYAQLQPGSTAVGIRKVTAFAGASAAITTAGTATLPITPAINEKWKIRIRATGTSLQARYWRTVDAEPGTWNITGTDASITTGRSFIRFDGHGTNTTNYRIWDFSYGPITSVNSLTTSSVSASSITDTSFVISAVYTGDADADSTCTLQYKKQIDETWTTIANTVNRGTKTFSATPTGLVAGTVYDIKATFADADGLSGVNPKVTTATTTFTGIDTGALSVVNTDTTVTVTATYTNDTDNDSTALLKFRILPAGTFDAGVAMTPDRPNKKFTATKSTLTADTQYEFQVTYSDADTVRGTNPLLISTTTLGKGVQFDSPTFTIVTTEIAAIVTVDYLYDTDQDSTCAIQYRPVHQAMWTTVNPNAININRVAKSFTTTIAGLIPGVSYQIQAILADPDGVNPGQADTSTSIFTTKGTVSDPDVRGKHYLHKVYDIDGIYMGTWKDAPLPEFSLEENGGVSDLSIRLPRTLSELNSDPTIQLGNRVDVWAVDGQSDGFGPNLIKDYDIDPAISSWTLDTSWSKANEGGPDDGAALRFSSVSTTVRTAYSEYVALPYTLPLRDENGDLTYTTMVVPFVAHAVAKARGGKIRMYIAAYDDASTQLGTSDDFAETVGGRWQALKVEYLPPTGTTQIRVFFQNSGKGQMYVDKVRLLVKEALIYRGRIESYTPKVKQSGESVDIQVLGLVSQLSDDYIRFLQYATFQPASDAAAGKIKFPPTDPSNIMKKIIDIAQEQNPRFDIYYTSDSIKLTDTVVEYTLRDQQLFAAIDKVRMLCPPGWSWYVEPDGKFWLVGPQHKQTHKLRLNVEVMEFENEWSLRNVKNYIILKGRQDSDLSEADKYGNIEIEAANQPSIDLYGRRVLFIRDANIKDPDTAALVTDGRLEENSSVGQRGVAYIPDEKDIVFSGQSLRGYNIEAFKPGDYVQIKDPTSGSQRTYWDQFNWDNSGWDSYTNRFLPQDVPIKTIQYRGDHVVLELSERQPNATGDFARLNRWLSLQDSDTSD